jgi:hypothetical protein
MMLQVLIAIALVTGTTATTFWLHGRNRYRAGRADEASDRATRAIARRRELRNAPPRGKHHLTPFPQIEDQERLTDTGELRILAETGDIEEIKRLNTAWFRTGDLKRWTRKRTGAAA